MIRQNSVHAAGTTDSDVGAASLPNVPVHNFLPHFLEPVQLDARAVQAVFDRLLSNYRKWCSFLMLKSVLRYSQIVFRSCSC